MASPQPVKFFCEFCGSLVRPADKICPHCGSFFNQVRCPVCQFQGESKLFYKGCPVCGFAAGSAGDDGKAKAAKPRGPATIKSKPGYEFGYVIEDKPAKAKTGMPGWVLALIALVCVGLAIAAIVVAGTKP